MKKFPDNFLWGSSTASYQVEGGIENNDWAQAAREGRVPVCGRGCDHYNLYEKDFDIIVALGHNTHKISIEWARIEPEEGVFNEKEIEHYKKVFSALRARKIYPIVNMWHFTLPLWFSKKGGFANSRAPFYFARYCAYVTGKLTEEKDFVTINEPMVFASNGYMQKNWPPFKKNIFTFLRVVRILIRSHNTAYKAMKKVRSDINIGISKNNIYFHSNSNPFNIFCASFMNWFWNRRFLNGIKYCQDYIGLNHYFHHKFGGSKKTYPKSDMGWDINPDALYHVLLELKRYKKPVLVTENGVADAQDTRRADFIRGHVDAVHRAIEAGVPVFGYLHWSLLDNYEWAFGFTKRFGLVEVNYDTLERKIRPSALEFKKICDANAL